MTEYEKRKIHNEAILANRESQRERAKELKSAGMKNAEIAEKMRIKESSVMSLLKR